MKSQVTKRDYPELVNHSDRLRKAVDRMIRKEFKHTVLVNDIVADTFQAAYERPQGWQGIPEKEVIYYLVSVARNLIRRKFRNLRIRREIQVGEPQNLPEVDRAISVGGTSPVRLMHREEKRKAMEQIFSRLKSESQREILKLVWIDGMKVKDAAEAMGRSANATSVLLHSAMASCRKIAMRHSFEGFRISGETR